LYSEELEALLNQREQVTSPDANPSGSSAASSTQNSPSSVQALPFDSGSGSASSMSFPTDLRTLLSPSTLEMNAQTIDPYFVNGDSGLIEAASAGVDAPLLPSSMGMYGDFPLLLVFEYVSSRQMSSGHIGPSTFPTRNSSATCKSFF
jgi:hypothetical protein